MKRSLIICTVHCISVTTYFVLTSCRHGSELLGRLVLNTGIPMGLFTLEFAANCSSVQFSAVGYPLDHKLRGRGYTNFYISKTREHILLKLIKLKAVPSVL